MTDYYTQATTYPPFPTSATEANPSGIIPAPSDDPPAAKPYSVLLLYPDYLDDSGYETFYAFVAASDPLDAVAAAQLKAVAAQDVEIDDPTDFHPLLVTQGHHYGEPLWDK